MKKIYWLSYDLGVGGDYDHLYQWLDDHEAKTCGNSIAFFTFDYEADADKELLESITSSVQLNPGNILYAIRVKEGSFKPTGSFLFGKRQSAPWVGFGSSTKDSVDE